ncbi:MAG: response regulator transcription factor [Dysgonomonas sp.]
MTPSKKKTVAVAETSYIIRKGLVYTLSQLSIVSKVIEIREHEDITYQLSIIAPDVVVINPMLVSYGLKHDIKQQLKLDKNTKVIALVYNLIDEHFYRSFDGIIRINDTESKIEDAILKCLNENLNTSDQEELSDREKDILISLVKGLSNKEIADFHNISIHTVITHRRNIGRKLGIHSVSGLTVYAIINKLVDIKEITI